MRRAAQGRRRVVRQDLCFLWKAFVKGKGEGGRVDGEGYGHCLVDVKGAGDGEEGYENYRGCLVRGVVPDTAGGVFSHAHDDE